ncbi:hypothetical protein RHGRI_014993 [Rhododendron griersonianum]|uniref:Uncharacterized protein n=1 Tax=Rhododendron griersonianum TaxID=479676 RepID=A0AAV6KBZ5_9ERIC|nr:hypothetical protein RHGRI_014993 [Rhododendron griersonianum]
MDGKATQPKRRRCPRKHRSTSAVGGNHIAPSAEKSNGKATAASKARSNSKSATKSQLVENNRMLVQTITRHLQELKNDNPPDSDSFNPTI